MTRFLVLISLWLVLLATLSLTESSQWHPSGFWTGMVLLGTVHGLLCDMAIVYWAPSLLLLLFSSWYNDADDHHHHTTTTTAPERWFSTKQTMTLATVGSYYGYWYVYNDESSFSSSHCQSSNGSFSGIDDDVDSKTSDGEESRNLHPKQQEEQQEEHNKQSPFASFPQDDDDDYKEEAAGQQQHSGGRR